MSETPSEQSQPAQSEQSKIDERLAAVATAGPETLDEAFAELDSSSRFRNERPSESEAEPEFEPVGNPVEVAGVRLDGHPLTDDEQAAVDDALGVTDFREQRWTEANNAETARQLGEHLEALGQQAQQSEYSEAVYDEALERLGDALYSDDVAAMWHAADQVAMQAPELVDDFCREWYESDPLNARRYAETLNQDRQNEAASALAQLQAWQSALEAAAVEQQVRAITEEGAQLAGEMVDAAHAETERLREADPAFDKLAPQVAEYARPLLEMIVNDGSLQTPEAAALAVRSGYEQAVTFHQAEAKAKMQLGLDEMLHNQQLARDRTGTMEPWDRDAALAKLTAEQLRPRELGAVTDQRSRTVKGLGTAANQARFTTQMQALDEVIDNPVAAEFARAATAAEQARK